MKKMFMFSSAVHIELYKCLNVGIFLFTDLEYVIYVSRDGVSQEFALSISKTNCTTNINLSISLLYCTELTLSFFHFPKKWLVAILNCTCSWTG